MLGQILGSPERYPSLKDALAVPATKGSTKETRLAFQRLEFLGDAVLYLASTEMLMKAFPNETEGELSIRRTWVIQEKSLQKFAAKVNLQESITKERKLSNHMQADVVEAILGAVYKDHGLEEAKLLVTEIMKDSLDGDRKPVLVHNNKGQLQQFVWKINRRIQVDYVTLEDSDDLQDRVCVSAIEIRAERFCQGQGRSKKEAESMAAFHTLEILQRQNLDDLTRKWGSEKRKRRLTKKIAEVLEDREEEEGTVTLSPNDEKDSLSEINSSTINKSNKRQRDLVAYDDL